ncbi:hypothetical protein QUA43_14825 [Microcoleus sp. N9_B4]
MLSEIRSRVRSHFTVWLSCNGSEASDRLNGARSSTISYYQYT